MDDKDLVFTQAADQSLPAHLRFGDTGSTAPPGPNPPLVVAPNDLVFYKPFDRSLPAHLVFGEEIDGGTEPVIRDTFVSIRGFFPDLVGEVSADLRKQLDFNVIGNLPGLSGEVRVRLDRVIDVVGNMPPLQGSVQVVAAPPVDVLGALPPLQGFVRLTPPQVLSVQGQLPHLQGQLGTVMARVVEVSGALDGLTGVMRSSYVSGAARPTVNETGFKFEDAQKTQDAWRGMWQAGIPTRTGTRVVFDSAESVTTWVRQLWEEGQRTQDAFTARFEDAMKLGTHLMGVPYQEGVRFTLHKTTRYEDAIRLGTVPVRFPYQEGLRDRRNDTAVKFEQGVGYWANWVESGDYGVQLGLLLRTRFEDAMKPPIGYWLDPVDSPEPWDPCYIPELPAHLLFTESWTGSPNLVFVCDRHDPPGPQPGATIVVPVKEVYLTINSATLLRLDNGYVIPTLTMSMSIDVDSWTWSFNASIPASALPYVQRNSNGDPVVVQAIINGAPYNFLLEGISRERVFGSSQLSVRGRGLSAELDAPYAHVTNFGNTQPRTAIQLMEDVLTFNNVSIGWDVVNDDLTDWTVPAGVFSHSGTYISALNTIVGAAGAYVQPHDTLKQLHVKLRYPTPAWEWDSVTPDIELPSAVTVQEGIEWENRPEYNRVFITGQQHGVLAQYTRDGTAGELQAPTVVNSLITHADPARQLGRSIISETGRIANVTLRLPVLAETGVIKPGNFVRYTDGAVTRMGLTRSVSVAVGMPTIYQTLTLETHP